MQQTKVQCSAVERGAVQCSAVECRANCSPLTGAISLGLPAPLVAGHQRGVTPTHQQQPQKGTSLLGTSSIGTSLVETSSPGTSLARGKASLSQKELDS